MRPSEIKAIQHTLQQVNKKKIALVKTFEDAKTPEEATLFMLAALRTGDQFVYWNQSAHNHPSIVVEGDQNGVGNSATFIEHTDEEMRWFEPYRGKVQDISSRKNDDLGKFKLIVPKPALETCQFEKLDDITVTNNAQLHVPSGQLRVIDPCSTHELKPYFYSEKKFFDNYCFVKRTADGDVLAPFLNNNAPQWTMVQGKKCIFINHGKMFGDFQVYTRPDGLRVKYQDTHDPCGIASYEGAPGWIGESSSLDILCLADAKTVHSENNQFTVAREKKTLHDEETGRYSVTPGIYQVTIRNAVVNVVRVK